MHVLQKSQGSFDVRTEQRGHAAYLYLTGDLDIATSPGLERCLLGAEDQANTAIVVDLEGVTFMDSTGVHSFLRAAQRASQSGRGFSIVGAPAAVRRVLHITRTAELLAEAHPYPSDVMDPEAAVKTN